MHQRVKTESPPQAVIQCGDGEASYKAVLTARGIGAFWSAVYRALEDGEMGNLKGEALVRDLLSRSGISSVQRCKGDGVLNDGPNGEPAVQKFNRAGKPSDVAHYRDGVLNDSATG